MSLFSRKNIKPFKCARETLLEALKNNYTQPDGWTYYESYDLELEDSYVAVLFDDLEVITDLYESLSKRDLFDFLDLSFLQNIYSKTLNIIIFFNKNKNGYKSLIVDRDMLENELKGAIIQLEREEASGPYFFEIKNTLDSNCYDLLADFIINKLKYENI